MTDLNPVLVGCGQIVQRDVDLGEARGPVELMVEAARRAADDARLSRENLGTVDSIGVVNILSWKYSNPIRLLGEAIGAQPSEEIYTTLGGNSPQWLVNETAAKIASGTTRLALLAGGEALSSVASAGKKGVQLDWWSGGEGRPTVVGDRRPGANEHERAGGLLLPIQVFPLFETGLRARLGRGVEAHRRRLGELCSRFTEVAAENPYAWFRRRLDADTIWKASPQNRMVGFPYTKYMNAIMSVDQAAAVLMTSVAHARKLGIPEERWIYLRASADATDRWFVSERRNYHSSPAIGVAMRRALEAAEVERDELTHLDLYSCFPVAVQIARAELGLSEDDPRPLTVTGGLPYAGGPGSNYTMHAIATMVDELRGKPEARGLVSALGWYLSKHSFGIYAGSPSTSGWRRAPDYDDSAEGGDPPPPFSVEAEGQAVVETCTVSFDREGAPADGIVVGRLAADRRGARFVARTPGEAGLLEPLLSDAAVGTKGTVRHVDGKNEFVPA